MDGLKVFGGFATDGHFWLVVEREGRWYPWWVGKEGAQAEEVPPPPRTNSLFLVTLLTLIPWRQLHPLLRGLLLVGLVVLALLALKSTGPKGALALPLGLLTAAFSLGSPPLPAGTPWNTGRRTC